MALLGFLALASLYDFFAFQNYASEEAMEMAQLARNVAQDKGYTTDSIRPLTLYLLESAAEPGQSSKVLAQRVPDLSNPPVYPYLLAGAMKMLPFKFDAAERWSYQPERWISICNQALLLCAALFLFFLARRLFDARVAWLSAGVLAGTELFWKFSISGLSTVWLIVVFLSIVWFLAVLEKRDRTMAGGLGASLGAALAVGVLVGVGGLTRYAFAWLIVPVILFVLASVTRGKAGLCAAIALSFIAVMAPWLARNAALSGHCFGTAGYAVYQGTTQFPGDTLERSTDPRNGLKRMTVPDVVNKFVANIRDICVNDLPELGGNWISAFFLAGLLMPFRNAGLNRLRWFLLGSLVWLALVEALTRTHVSRAAPQVNSENLLVVLAPLVFVYGVALFYTLLDQLELPPVGVAGPVVTVFVVVLSAPFLLALLVPPNVPELAPHSPLHIRQTASYMQTNELMASDIPSGVAWYGERSALWLPLDDGNEFFKVSALKPIKGLFLTEVTTDKRFLSQMKSDPHGWGGFVFECGEHGEVPSGFPLRKAPVGFLPDELFLSDKARW
jgi:4-amino-4-deoxy-L-arabinose transferase-like glycosyltransferase